LYAGRLDQLARNRSEHWLDPRTIAEPFLFTILGMARIVGLGRRLECGPLPGVITRRGWTQLAAALTEAAADPSVRWIFLEIDSVVQQVKGFGGAMQALRRARSAKGVTACVRAAGGLAVPLASACDLITSTPAAPIGWLRWGTFEGSPDESPGRNQGMENMLESRRVCRRFGYRTLPAFRSGSIHGEQLEGRGIDWLSVREAL